MSRGGWRYWRNLAVFALCIVSLVAAIGCLSLARWRAMALVHPPRRKPHITPADHGIHTWEDVAFASADGTRLVGWFIPPDPGADGAAIVYLHGLGNNRSELLDQAAMLREHGYGGLLFDLRNHGDSGGTTTTLGYTEVEDLRGAVAYLLTRPEVSADRIGVVSQSMGSAVALRGAPDIPEIRALVVQSAFSSIEDNIAEGVKAFAGLPPFPFAPLVIWFCESETGLAIRLVRPIDEVARISPRPILFLHGELDPAIPVENAIRLYEAAGEPKELYVVPGAGHGGFLDVAPDACERRIVDFMNAYMHSKPGE
jgi:fermentation-respiration switch protein FrsA (DUF1100 family)